MPIRKGVSRSDYLAATYMVEVYWVACMPPQLGVLVFRSTRASERSGGIGDWKVFFHEGLHPGCILGSTRGQQLGYVSAVYPEAVGSTQGAQLGCVSAVYPEAAPYTTMAGFLTDKFVYVYHAWVGYSPDRFTVEQYHAIDFYWQEPGSIHSEMYHWYVLLDVNEPVNWNRARRALICGKRGFHGAEYQARL